MRRTLVVLVIGVLSCAVYPMGCMDRAPAPVCPVPTELAQNDFMPGGFEGVDVLMVVDNSGTMASEQEVLASSIFTLVNSLVNPLPDWEYAAADNVRFAVVSTDMGLQAGGEPYDSSLPWPSSAACNGNGDDGHFQTYDMGKTVGLPGGEIPCEGGGGQCPLDWECSVAEAGQVGTCTAPVGSSMVACPAVDGSWAFTEKGDLNPDLPLQVSCLSSLGTMGCGFEQQLESAAQSLSMPSQSQFVRDESLLAIIVVSDEEDCSIESGEGLANAPEMGGDTINIACGKNEQHLYSPEHYREVYSGLKGEQSDAVLFAAITGVPMVKECQGQGHQIEECLALEAMQNKEYFDDAKGYYMFTPACETASTEASPGRRYVALANEFENMGYIYSICNDDWSPAMSEIARLIAEKVGGTCYDKPLDWDPSTRQAKCDVVVELVDEDLCPAGFDDAEPIEEKYTDSEGVEHSRLICTLPRLSAPRDCSEMDEQPSDLGWYYCENGVNAVEESPELCRYEVQLTRQTRELIRGSAVSIQCMQQFTFEDDNCREDSEDICADGADNDGNGVFDCWAKTGDGAHFADPGCCPMSVGASNKCQIEDRAFDICPGTSESEPSDACVAAADLLGCNIP